LAAKLDYVALAEFRIGGDYFILEQETGLEVHDIIGNSSFKSVNLLGSPKSIRGSSKLAKSVVLPLVPCPQGGASVFD
jgi:hypothetical protein